MQSENWSLDDLKEYECPICENSFKIGLTYNDKHMCTKCYDKLMKDLMGGKSKMVCKHVNKMEDGYFKCWYCNDCGEYIEIDKEKEGKEMVKENETIEILDIAGVAFVKEHDYLKVVEEKEKLKIKLDTVTTFRNGYYKEVEELKRENESLHENLDNLDKKLKEMTNHKDKTFLKLLDIEKENEKLEEHINVLISTLESMKDEEEQEYTYTLVYTYWCECDEIEKKYKQTGLLKEEYEEMYGMDSDNWISHTLLKEVR